MRYLRLPAPPGPLLTGDGPRQARVSGHKDKYTAGFWGVDNISVCQEGAGRRNGSNADKIAVHALSILTFWTANSSSVKIPFSLSAAKRSSSSAVETPATERT